MRRIIVTEFISLDGIIEDPGGAENYKHGGWTRPYWNDEIAKIKFGEIMGIDAHLLGRVTYEGFATAWPNAKDTGEFGDRMNNLPKYVVSTTLQKADWNNSTIIRANVADEIASLKGQSGQDILVAGSATLVHTLLQHDLVDEFRLLIYPVILGSGKRLFKENDDVKLKLLETAAFSSGVVYVRYQPERR